MVHIPRATVMALLGILAGLTVSGSGATRYVWSASPSPGSGFTSWATAAHRIQDAVDVAVSGDTVIVTNGFYDSGGRACPGYSLTNRVCLTNAVCVKSVNGADVTIIAGSESGGGGNGDAAVRCAYVNTNATLLGFSLTNGHTRAAGGIREQCGGGAFCDGSGTISNCVLSGNSASSRGGGAAYGTLWNCVLSGNTCDQGGGAFAATLYNCLIAHNTATWEGGGAYNSTLYNCTVVTNMADSAGGLYGGTAENSIVYDNAVANSGTNWVLCTLTSSCADPNPGGDSVAGPPVFVDAMAGNYRLAVGSPCVDSGANRAWMGAVTDLGGAPRILASRVDMGAYEYYGAPIVDITNEAWQVFGEVTNVTVGGTNNAYVTGVMSWTNDTGGSGSLPASSQWSIASIGLAFGPNTITVSGCNPGGEWTSDSVVVTRSFVHGGSSTFHYASTNGADIWPYTNWATAARILHNAANVAAAGDTVWVSNGVYAVGGGLYGYDDWTPSRVGVPSGVKVLSVNGPTVTTIRGQPAVGGGNGEEAIRCVFLESGATLAGFTLTNGYTKRIAPYKYGGGVLCSGDVTISNCLIVACSSAHKGGGVMGGTILNSMIAGCSVVPSGSADPSGGGVCQVMAFGSTICGNSAPQGGGAKDSTLTDCVVTNNTATNGVGGGVCGGVVSRCLIEGNRSTGKGAGAYGANASNCVIRRNSVTGPWSGGGVSVCSLWSCALYRNSAVGGGGGASESDLYNCTVVGNSSGGGAGGLLAGTARNTLVAFNAGTVFPDTLGTALTRCRTSRLRSSDTGIEDDPLLADYLHISAGSPCRGAGVAGIADPDIDGDSWLGTPSIGCDEFSTASATGSLAVSIVADYTNVAVGFSVSLSADISGHALGHTWDFGDGVQSTNRLFTSHVWLSPGTYPVMLRAWNNTFPAGVVTTTTVTVVAQPVRYVNRTNSTPLSPYAGWSTAATNIQSAIDLCSVPGSLVLVTNGVYDTGSDATVAGWTTRIIVTNATVIRSVNGPDVTFIAGVAPSGPACVRCVYVGPKSQVIGFTLTNGAAYTEVAAVGGGAYCDAGGVLSNCIVRNCVAASGGGVYGGTLYNGKVLLNEAVDTGAGVDRATLRNCLVASNYGAWQGSGIHASDAESVTVWGNSSDSQRGGAYNSSFRNSVIWSNSAAVNHPNADSTDCDFMYSCVLTESPPPPFGVGNVYADPLFASSEEGDFRLTEGSPCIDSGTNADWMAGSPDLGGAPRIINARVDMGAFEYYGAPVITITNAPGSLLGENVSYTFRGTANPYVIGSLVWAIEGPPEAGTQMVTSVWAVDDVPLVFGSNVFTIAGSNPGGQIGVATAIVVRLTEHGGASPVHYASPSGASVWPYATWANAARDIQDALNAAVSGDTVLVTNGTYASGGMAVAGSMTNRVSLSKAVVLRSVNGPAVTMIEGAAAAGGGDGDGAVRCAYVGTNATLCGFTLTNGHTRADGDLVLEQRGGGAWCEPSGMISNCVLVCNSANKRGGGVAGGLLCNCLVALNSSDGGGGAYMATLRNCTVEDNTASSDGGGASGCTVYNSIVCHNTPDNLFGGSASYSCSSPLPPGAGNIDTAPSFIDRPNGNYRLAPGSAGVDSGSTSQAPSNDLDAIPRPLDGDADGTNRVDMGAYELASATSDSDGDMLCDRDEILALTDPLNPDTDADGAGDGEESFAGTNPLDPTSVLALLTPVVQTTGVVCAVEIRWSSVDSKSYSLNRSTNLVLDAYGQIVTSGVQGTYPVNVVTDHVPSAAGPCFYRIKVE